MISFMPKTGRSYFYISVGNKIKETIWKGSEKDFLRLKIGNVFPTHKRALNSGFVHDEEEAVS